MPRKTYYGYTDAQKRAEKKYRAEKVETIAVRVPKGKKAYYKQKADSMNMSLNQFAISSMNEKIERDNL